jgi:hypothetical protein
MAVAISISGCGGQGDDSLGENAAEEAENRADNLEALADNATGADAKTLDALADAQERQGEQLEEAVDDSDVNAAALSDDQKNKVVNGQ